MKGIANGLSGIHHFGVFHGDLTCGNSNFCQTRLIFLVRVNINDYDGSIPFDHVFISNLGIHHWFAKWNPKTHQMMKIPATQQYCAPEVLEDGREEVSIQSDIWAVGCIGAEILTGRPLFPTEQAVELYTERGVVDDAQNALFAMHPQISKILMGCLQKDKAKRWRVWQLQDHIEQARQAFAIESQRNAVIRAIDTANRRLV
jgi:serine/threonine protein kinase